MAELTRNLCAQIPVSLHTQVRERQEASGKTLGQYMTWLITKFYEEEKPTMKGNQRTVAFQVPEELFERFKEYLKRQGVKQNAFFLNCIQQALDAEAQSGAGEEEQG
ncbi:hypothetical protein [uncultured Oscillibacter sp.]|uniref:hypothetical protein n=1 Tax=uncultured Oscillibacter sp. TaxID=876091 RepID=UPI00272AD3CB|nr:hypothetical protein [uncultured Oscillibacter sp.]